MLNQSQPMPNLTHENGYEDASIVLDDRARQIKVAPSSTLSNMYFKMSCGRRSRLDSAAVLVGRSLLRSWLGLVERSKAIKTRYLREHYASTS